MTPWRRSQAGKAVDCKSTIRRFDSGRRLHPFRIPQILILPALNIDPAVAERGLDILEDCL